MTKKCAIDSEGNSFSCGDWVAFETAPLSLLKGLMLEDQQAIQEQAGVPVRVEGFDECGNVELEFRDKEISFRTIWIEPQHLSKVRFTQEALTKTGTRQSEKEKKWREATVGAWIEMSRSLQRFRRPEECDENIWVSFLMYDLVEDRPEEAWILIDAIRHATDDIKVLAHLAAGHLEDLLAKHGDKFIERFEALAKNDKDFAQMLGGVWKSGITDDVWSRIRKIALKPKWD